MEFAEDHAAAEFIIHSCSAEGVRVNGQDLTESFMLLPGQPVQAWPVTAGEPLKAAALLNGNRVSARTGGSWHGRRSPVTGPGDLRGTAEPGDRLGSDDHNRGLPNL